MADEPTLPVRTVARYGWKPDLPDFRDYLLAVRPPKKLPDKVSLRAEMPPVYDQGQIGSCTANAIGAALEHGQRRQKKARPATPSRLFIYYNERVMEGTVGEDSGAYIRDGVKSVNILGAPPETLWPYDEARFTEQPPKRAYTTALRHQALSYARVTPTTAALQSVLAAGFPIMFGFTVFETFESNEVAKNGRVPMPASDERLIGGHAVLLIGYDVTSGLNVWEVRNSWSADWGDDGYCWFPGSYLVDSGLAADFWTIRLVE
jgi:C1A family cysteine protease